MVEEKGINFGKLRREAEKLLNQKLSESTGQLSESEVLKLLHELEVHQIELELQNQELKHANQIANEASEKYLELFDFAPTGYFSLSKDGKLLELNHAGAHMLGKVRSQLTNRVFSHYISEDSKPAFLDFCNKAYNSNQKETCEIKLSIKSNFLGYFVVFGLAKAESETCLLNFIDITKRKKAEEELQKHKENLEILVKERTKELEEKNAELEEFNQLFVGREFRIHELKEKIDELKLSISNKKEE